MRTKERDNNFNLVRFLAAFSVLVSHSFALATGHAESQPLYSSLGIGLGAVAVDVFFVSSGYLITASLLNRANIIDFTRARVLRIYPALIVMVVLTVFVMGPLLTSDRAYLADPATYAYLWKNAMLFPGSPGTLPGVFEHNPYGNGINGSLWTLPYEIRMYALAATVWMTLYLIKGTRAFTGAIVVIALLALGWHFLRHDQISRLYLMFMAGAAFYVLRIKLIWPVFVALAAMLVASTLNRTAFPVIYALSVPYLTLFAAIVPGGVIRRFNALGDYSYGIYIYAFPVQQCIVALIPGIHPVAVAAGAALTAIPCAMLSWHFLEKPALRMAHRYHIQIPLHRKSISP